MAKRGPVLATLFLVAAAAGPGSVRADPANPLSELVEAAAQRLQVAESVAAAKWRTGTAVEDPARVRQQLDALGAAADAAGLDPGYVTAIFADQIAATEALQYRRFAEWKLDGSAVPVGAPEFAASRDAIDALNQVMLDQIRQRWPVLRAPECAALREQATDVAGRTLDGFYQQALTAATRSYCRP